MPEGIFGEQGRERRKKGFFGSRLRVSRSNSKEGRDVAKDAMGEEM